MEKDLTLVADEVVAELLTCDDTTDKWTSVWKKNVITVQALVEEGDIV